MSNLSLHLAPNAPWLLLAALTLGLVGLGLWAYRFAIPPLPELARRLLPSLRIGALALLLWLLAQPVLERAVGAGGLHLAILLDRSRSMDLPATAGGGSRAAAADRAVRDLERAWRGRASIQVLRFASSLSPDTGAVTGRGETALGDALVQIGQGGGPRADGVVVVSDGAVNAGADPVAAARSLGVPVHAVVIGEARGSDRAVAGVEASVSARVGEATPVRVRVVSTEERGTPIRVRLLDEGRELGQATVLAPGGGAEVTAEFRVTPLKPGLAVWTARVDSLPGQVTAANDARQVAVEVAPGKLGVLIVSAEPNWDLAFLRRSIAGDSSLEVTTLVREKDGWRWIEKGRPSPPPSAAALAHKAVLVLDALPAAQVSAEFDAAAAAFARDGGGLLLLGGPLPGLPRFSNGRLGQDCAVSLDAGAVVRNAAPRVTPEGRELLAWDDDPSRGDRAWEAAAPLSDLAPVAPTGGDRVLIASREVGPPLLIARRIGRGQALLVNGTGLWRWTLSGHDDLAADRGRRLWRRIARWLAEPVQGEPLRLRPERWLSAGGEPVRLFATLQDAAFRPLAGATVEGELRDASGRARPLSFAPGTSGSYAVTLDDLPAGRYRASASARRGGQALGRAETEFAVDRWSIEELRTLPDSATMAAVAQASGGRVAGGDVARWARGLETRALARPRTETARLWESPWAFAFVVGALSLEWAWRRRRGLP